MNRKKWDKKNTTALVATLLIHAIVVVGLLFLYLPFHDPDEEEMGGIMVNIGDMIAVEGSFNPDPIRPLPEYREPAREELPPDDALLTQESEDAPTVPEQPTVEELERKREAERLRQEELRKQREQAEAQRRQERIRKNVSGAFGKAKESQGSGDTPGAQRSGHEGSPDGNVERGGASTGVGGFGSYSLDGRRLVGHLPRPGFTAQVEGTIVVQITVDPSGRVIDANFGAGTTITDYGMRESALAAARKARFTESSGLGNQVGTITYRYRLR